MSWAHVFNTSHHCWGSISAGRTAAEAAHYKFFLWSGRVYYTESGTYTGLTIEELK